MKRTILTAMALMVPASAFAWKHTNVVWGPHQMPVRYWVSDDGTENTDCDSDVPPGYCEEAAVNGFNVWTDDPPCADGLSHEHMGLGPNTGFATDNQYNITFNDPQGQLEDPGTLAAALCPGNGQFAFILDGWRYTYVQDCDITFNENTLFDTSENIRAGQCNGGSNMQETMTHEIGHTLGMGHSCDEYDICTDSDKLAAVMYWTGPPCSFESESLNEDDIEGITALYGPFADFACSHERDPNDPQTIATGVVPFDLNCVVVSEDAAEIDEASWTWGDGQTSEGMRVSHTYEEQGNYNVELYVHGNRDACGEEGWSYTQRRSGYVRACGVAEAAFEIEQTDGLEHQFLNETSLAIYGCITNVQWDIYEGEGTGTKIDSKQAWEPQFTFPGPGTYTVVLNVGGPAGTGAAQATFDVKRSGGTNAGCSTVAPVGLGFGGLALIGLLGLRRR